jgi:hypothetical protein
MATPQFAIQQLAFNVPEGNPASLVIPATDTTGTNVDISSGYTTKSFKAAPDGDRNPAFPTIDVSGIGSFVYASGSLTWNLTAAQANSLAAALPTVNSQALLRISNDSGTTSAVLAQVRITVDQLNLLDD